MKSIIENINFAIGKNRSIKVLDNILINEQITTP